MDAQDKALTKIPVADIVSAHQLKELCENNTAYI